MKRKQQKNQQELKNLRVRDLTETELEKIDGGNFIDYLLGWYSSYGRVDVVRGRGNEKGRIV